jgi:GNAT superfamily N-acetyltransferase
MSSLYRKTVVIFHEFYLDGFAKSWENPFGVCFERYHKRDAELLKETLSGMDTPRLFDLMEVDRRLKNGHLFYIAKKDNHIIGYTWFAVKRINIVFYYATLILSDDEVFAYHAYIHRDFRGKRIYNTLLAFAFSELKKAGIKRVIGSYDSRNKAAKRASEHLGRIPFGFVKFYNFLTLRFQKADLPTNTIIFYGGPFALWKKLFGLISS